MDNAVPNVPVPEPPAATATQDVEMKIAPPAPPAAAPASIGAILRADLIQPSHHIKIGAIRPGKSNNRLVDLNRLDMKSPDGKSFKIYIQFTGPTKFQDWAVDVNPQYGSTYLKFNVRDNDEAAGMDRLETAIQDKGVTDRNEYWPGKNYSPELVRNNRTPLIGEPKLKDDSNPEGGYWPRKMSVKVPLRDDGSLDPRAVTDEDGKCVDLNEVPGRYWKKIIISVDFHYFKGKKGEWGTSKKLVKMQLCNQQPQGQSEGSGSASRVPDLAFLD